MFPLDLLQGELKSTSLKAQADTICAAYLDYLICLRVGLLERRGLRLAGEKEVAAAAVRASIVRRLIGEEFCGRRQSIHLARAGFDSRRSSS